MPSLEIFCAALLLSKLVRKVKSLLQFNMFFYDATMVMLSLIKKEPYHFKMFVLIVHQEFKT